MGDVLAGLGDLAAPPARRTESHLDLAAVARMATGDEPAGERRHRLMLLVFPALRADAYMGGVGREAAESILTAAAASGERRTRAGLLCGFTALLEARSVAVAMAGGLADGFPLRAALAARRGTISDFNPVALAAQLRADRVPVPDVILNALLAGAARARTLPVAGAVAASAAGAAPASSGPPPAARPTSPPPAGRRGGRGGGRGGRGRGAGRV